MAIKLGDLNSTVLQTEMALRMAKEALQIASKHRQQVIKDMGGSVVYYSIAKRLGCLPSITPKQLQASDAES